MSDAAEREASRVWRVGAARIALIEETGFDLPVATLLPTLPAADAPSDTASLSVHAWLVTLADTTGERRILIDAGIGNHKSRANPAFDGLDTPWLDRLAMAGAPAGSVTDVLITHLHPDHVGWLTRRSGGAWVPTFPAARVFLPRAGYDFFRSDAGRGHRNAPLLADSIEPVVAAGQVTFIDAAGRPDGAPLPPGFSYLPSPGHAIDHFSIRLATEGTSVLFAGDVMHQPVQVTRPGHSSMFCAAPAQAEASRRKMLDLAARDDALVCSSHFPFPAAGRVGATVEGYAWREEPPG